MNAGHESDVCLFTFPSSRAVVGGYEECRFPRAGAPNPGSKLELVQFVLSESLQMVDVCMGDLQYTLSVVFPWLECVVRVGWTPDSEFVWLQGMSGRRQRLDVVLIPLGGFCEACSGSASLPAGDHGWTCPFGGSITPLQVIYTQTAST